MKLNTCLYAIICLIGLVSCNDFLDKESNDKIFADNFFKSEAEIQMYTYSFYETMTPSAEQIATGDNMADYTSKNRSPKFISGAYSSLDESPWQWENLRNINYFIVKVENSPVEQEIKNHYLGIARLFRAMFYFDMVVKYGDVPWYSVPLKTNDEGLYKSQDPRKLVMDNVLIDLQFASDHINDKKDASASTITKQVANGLASRICLFEGTFRKYHKELGLEGTAESWLRESTKFAKQVMDSGKYKLYEGNYRDLFISESPKSEEVMWASNYNAKLQRFHSLTRLFNTQTTGNRWGLIRQFVNTYLNQDGTRFTDNPNHDQIVFTEEVKNRDSRLYATIRTEGYKRSDGSLAAPNMGYTFTGYHILKFSLDEKRLDTDYESYNSVPVIRYAEVLLNYAEAKTELGEMNKQVWDQTIGKLRGRAKLPTKEPIVADSYLMNTYFPNITDKYLLEVRRERGIELVFEGFRFRDLLRWKKGELIEMEWKGIYVPALNQPIDLNNDGKADVIFTLEGTEVNNIPNYVYNYKINPALNKLSNGNSGVIITGLEEKRSFTDKKYLYPISNDDIVLNPNLKQNPGWE